MLQGRLADQIGFLLEADKLKTILRRTPLADSSRFENSAEHSWHLALAAIVLHEYAPTALNLQRVLELVTVHDLVEIDAGDTFAYDVSGQETRVKRERAAADRLFGLLPPGQAGYVRRLWDEFEEQKTSESRFANAIDRMQALLLNSRTGGGSWRTHDVRRSQVLRRMAPVERELPDVWPYVLEIVERFCGLGVIGTDDPTA